MPSPRRAVPSVLQTARDAAPQNPDRRRAHRDDRTSGRAARRQVLQTVGILLRQSGWGKRRSRWGHNAVVCRGRGRLKHEAIASTLSNLRACDTCVPPVPVGGIACEHPAALPESWRAALYQLLRGEREFFRLQGQGHGFPTGHRPERQAPNCSKRVGRRADARRPCCAADLRMRRCSSEERKSMSKTEHQLSTR